MEEFPNFAGEQSTGEDKEQVAQLKGQSPSDLSSCSPSPAPYSSGYSSDPVLAQPSPPGLFYILRLTMKLNWYNREKEISLLSISCAFTI